MPGYRWLLEQTLFPQLKRRPRNDDDTQEDASQRAIFLASDTLLTLVKQLPVLVLPSPARSARATMVLFDNTLELHLEKMQAVILPAVYAHWDTCNMVSLTDCLARRPAPSAPAHSPGSTNDAR